MGIRNRRKKGRILTRETREKRIDFTRKVHPVKGIISFIMAIASFVGFLVLCIISAVYGGNAGIVIGIIGLFLFLLNLSGVILALLCFKMYNIHRLTVITGLSVNGAMMVVYISLYLVGLFG